MGKTKVLTEEQKQKKREKERERRKRIREDPIKNAEQKQKEKDKYLRQRREGVRKCISEMTPREKRIKRKEWKNYSRLHRQRKRQRIKLEENLRMGTPPPSDTEDNVNNSYSNSFSSRKEIGKRLSIRNRVKRYRQKLKTKQEIDKLKKKLEMYKKRYERLKKRSKDKLASNSPSLTPGTRVNRLVEESRIDPHKTEMVKKKLLFGEVIKRSVRRCIQTFEG